MLVEYRKGQEVLWIVRDEHAVDPLELDGLGTLITDPEYIDVCDELTRDSIQRAQREAYVILPIYRYVNNSCVNERFTTEKPIVRSKIVGYIYATLDDCIKYFNCKYVTEKIVTEQLSKEIQCYSAWVNDEVYGFEYLIASGDDLDFQESAYGYYDEFEDMMELGEKWQKFDGFTPF